MKSPQRGYCNSKHFCMKYKATKFIEETVPCLKLHVLHSVIMGNYNNPLLPIDKSFQQKINSDMMELNNIMNQMNLADIY